MKNSKNKSISRKKSPSMYDDLSKIDELVDKIIEKNREKLDRIHAEQIETDVEKFSLKNKKNNIIYYLKKKSSKNTDEETDKEILSDEIIDEARENLGEEPLEKKKKSKTSSRKESTHKLKKRIRFGKKDKKEDKSSIKPLTTEEIVESEEFDEVVTEIEEILKDEKPDQIDEEAKIIDEKILETPEIDDSSKEKNKAEEKVEELAKKHKFFSKKGTSEGEDKKDKDWVSSSTDDLAGLKKKYSKNLTIKDMDSSDDEVEKDESNLLDEKIKETPILKDTEEGEIKKVEEEKGASSKLEKSFFRKKPSSKKKEADKKPKDEPKEEPKKEPEAEESEKLFTNLKFRVDYFPEGDEEAKIIDEKIKDTSEKGEAEEENNVAEAKALKLAQEHLEEKPVPLKEKDELNKKPQKSDIEVPLGVPLTDGDPDHEHVFFDEEESSFKGWSPQITEKEKKSVALSTTGQGEVGADRLKEVGELELPKEVLQTNSVKLADLGFSENDWEELDFYSLYEPFAYVEILRERESLDKCYFLVEIELTTEEEKLLGFLQDTMRSIDIDPFELEAKGDDAYLLERLNQVIEEYNVNINEESKKKIFYYIGKGSLGLGKIDPLMKDPNIEDISCDGSGVPLFLYHRRYGSLKSNIRFNDEDELASFVHKLAQKCGKHISIAEPMLDATMPDGSRIQMTLSDEITAKGSTFTIRKFRADPFSPPDLVEFNTMSAEMIAYMWLAIENGINTLFAGGTASGKTTMLNALSLFIPRESKIVSIEETREINLPHPNWIPGVARSGFGEVVADKVVGEIDMYDLMKAALRQRPEYILVGEIRGREAYVLFQAMATGHATYSTVHADSAQSLIHRLEGKPINIPRIMLQSLDIVCLNVITRVKNVRARRCKQIIEIIDIDPTTKEILTNEVFRWEPVEDRFIYSGKSYVLERVRAERDLSREEMTEEIKNRKKIVEWMNANNIREFRDVAKLVAQYNEVPEETLRQIDKGAKK